MTPKTERQGSAWLRPVREGGISSQHLTHHPPVDVGEAEVAALGAVGEELVVEAEAVEEGGLDVVDVDGVLRLA
jgi:hypothetical protein